jgi:putative transposase
VRLAPVRSAFALSKGTSGSPRRTRDRPDTGLAGGRRRTARLRRETGLRARQPRRFKRTTDSLHAVPVAPNLIAPDVSTERPDETGGADLSSLGTREGWLSLAGVMDLFARRGVGWAVSDRLHKEGGSPPCAEPWSCDDQRWVCFIIRTAVVHLARSRPRPSCASTAS